MRLTKPEQQALILLIKEVRIADIKTDVDAVLIYGLMQRLKKSVAKPNVVAAADTTVFSED